MSASPSIKRSEPSDSTGDGIEERLAVDKTGGREETSFEAIGLSPKAGWYLTATLLFGASVLMIAMLSLSDSLPKSILPLALTSLAMSPICLVGARFFPYAEWGVLFRAGLGSLIIGVGGLLIGPPITALTFLMLFPLMGVAYLHKPSVSVPYTLATILVMPLVIGLSAPLAFTIVTTLSMAMLAFAAIVAQNQLRSIASVTRDLSVTDPLTGLANLRRLQARAHDALLAAGRGGEPVLLVAIDLDDFKEVNDRFDHTRGDELLCAVGEALSQTVAPSDLLARRGGDEFAVLVPTMMGRDPAEFQRQLRDAVREARMRVCPEVNPEGSVAYVVSRAGESVDALVERADEALHDAKLHAHPERRFMQDESQMTMARARHEEQTATPRGQTADHLAAASAAQTAEELRIARGAQRSLGTSMAWDQAAAMSLIIGTVLAVLSIANVVPSLHGWAGAWSIGALLLLPIAFIWASKRELNSLWLRGGLIATMAALTAAMLVAGDARWQLVDLFVVPTMFSMYFLSFRKAIPFAVGGLALYTLLLVTTSYPYPVVRAVSTITLVTLMALMLAKARGVTRQFTRKAVEMSVVDPLTGAANLRGLRQRITDEIERCQATGKKLALLAIDLDDFKAVNDRYSHTRGDEVLVATAHAIRDQVRADELVARRGGDEFAAVCIFDDETAAREVSLRIAEAIAAVRLKLCPDTRPTASVGYIVWMPGESTEAFLSRADRELHGAKERSRAVHVA